MTLTTTAVLVGCISLNCFIRFAEREDVISVSVVFKVSIVTTLLGG